MISLISRKDDLTIVLRKCESREFLGKKGAFQESWVRELLGESVPFLVRTTNTSIATPSETPTGDDTSIWICLPWEYHWVIQDGDLQVYKGLLPIDDAWEPDEHLRKILRDTEDWFKPLTRSDIVDIRDNERTGTEPKQEKQEGTEQQWSNPLNPQSRERDTIIWRSRVIC